MPDRLIEDDRRQASSYDASMLVLGINTVADACEAALVRDGVVVAELGEPMKQGHDARLAPVIAQLMREGGAAFPDLDRIAVVVGPGSFTGVRVGVAFARGLSVASGRPTPSVGVTSLEALDRMPREKRVLGLLPAKRRPPEKTWWMQVLEAGRGVCEPSEIHEGDLPSLFAGVDTVCGVLAGVPDIGKPRIEAKPTAASAALVASRLSSELPEARPVYVREPDAKPMERP
jgi:tRNA threonylcarbamoyladenosine biosynthesis protein TsaB